MNTTGKAYVKNNELNQNEVRNLKAEMKAINLYSNTCFTYKSEGLQKNF